MLYHMSKYLTSEDTGLTETEFICLIDGSVQAKQMHYKTTALKLNVCVKSAVFI